MPAGAPVAASLDDPFYYLANFAFVLDWVAARHGDLLSDEEHDFLAAFRELPWVSRALLVRMVMRKGEHFRTARLAYAEIGDTATALAPLVEAGFIDPDPELSLETLFAQLRLAELRRAFAAEVAVADLGRATKAALREALAPRFPESRRLAAWWPEHPASERIVRLTVMATCDRLRLMFFGNLRQDWAEFVLAELGLQRFERVAFTADSRAFQRREEVDAYLALHRLRERLEAGESAAALCEALPAVPEDNAWLVTRRNRLRYRLGREAERDGETEAALSLYLAGGWGPGGEGEVRIRGLRLLERLGEHRRALTLADRLAAQPIGDGEAQALARLRPRLCRRLGLVPPAAPPDPEVERWELCLAPGAGGVELAVCDHLHRADAPVHYVENALLTGLFGLLCWEALYAPLPGAFFHPFHSGPADLYREDFVARRRERFATCLARLDDGRYREAIRATWRAKHGIASHFVHWERLDAALIDQALACLPPSTCAPAASGCWATSGPTAPGCPTWFSSGPRRRRGSHATG